MYSTPSPHKRRPYGILHPPLFRLPTARSTFVYDTLCKIKWLASHLLDSLIFEQHRVHCFRVWNNVTIYCILIKITQSVDRLIVPWESIYQQRMYLYCNKFQISNSKMTYYIFCHIKILKSRSWWSPQSEYNKSKTMVSTFGAPFINIG